MNDNTKTPSPEQREAERYECLAVALGFVLCEVGIRMWKMAGRR